MMENAEEENERLKYLSECDSLTSIPNRRKYDELITVALEKSISNKSNLAVLLIDIDFFKQYNDNYGHLQGDACLINVANTIKYILGESSFVARYGGDEFVVVVD